MSKKLQKTKRSRLFKAQGTIKSIEDIQVPSEFTCPELFVSQKDLEKLADFNMTEFPIFQRETPKKVGFIQKLSPIYQVKLFYNVTSQKLSKFKSEINYLKKSL